MTPLSHFNPRTPVGCDHRPIKGAGLLSGISIHAPQWGATHGRRVLVRPRVDFNPRTPVGCDSCPRRNGDVPDDFNPRTPVGCDKPCPSRCGTTCYFNPRTPVGCDLVAVWDIGVIVGISIHAPQWGATTPFTVTRLALIFQSTHPSGVRPVTGTSVISLVRFQSTHPSGVRQLTSVTISSVAEFQSTHPSGVRLSCGLPT